MDFRSKKITITISPQAQKSIKKIKDKKLLHKIDKKLQLFQQNPYHPSLRFKKYHHPDGNHWEISITMSYRMILRVEEKEECFEFEIVAFGRHDILDRF